MNHLYFGDCLDVLKQLSAEHPQPFIDLIYIDPPFNSKRNYNVLFESIDMKDANAQKQAFSDTWSNYSYVDTLNELAELHKDLYDLLNLFHNLKSISDGAVAYLTTMSIRILYMHKLLKNTGSFYLHCDPTMSHYLKLVCDMIFGDKNFRNEISWTRSQPKSHNNINFPNCRDVILRYSKSEKAIFNKIFGDHNIDYIDKFYRFVDEDGRRYRLGDITNPNKNRPNLTYEFLGVKRVWRWTKERMQKAYEEGKIYQSKPGAVPQEKRYLDSMEGQPIGNDWNDIEHLHGSNNESLGYPTQKPEALLERIIKASSNEGDVVADFFCGCGTTIAAAQKLNRKWLGADISHLAIRLIKKRLVDTYGMGIEHNIKMHGLPRDVASARELAQNISGGRIGFQDWVIEVMLNGVVNEKKVADGGYDGYLTFYFNNKKQFALIETKSGKLTVKNMREFVRVIQNQNAAVGVFVCFEENVTREMIKEARDAGHIRIDGIEFSIDKIQIITVEELFTNKKPQLPGSAVNQTFKQAKRSKDNAVSQGLFD